jgi:hypothetical protein
VVSFYPPLEVEKPLDSLGHLISIGTTNFAELDIAPSHSQLGVGNGVVIEAVQEGVVASRAVDHFLHVVNEGGAMTVHGVPDITMDQRVSAARMADQMVKKKLRYNFLGLALGIPGGERSKYCSELAHAALKESGVDIQLGMDGTVEDAAYSLIPPLGLVPHLRISPQELKRASVGGEPLVTEFEYIAPRSAAALEQAARDAIQGAAEGISEAIDDAIGKM